MASTSTIVQSISSPQKSASAPASTAKNLAVPLAVLLSLAVIGSPSSRSCLVPTAAPTVAPTISGLYKPTAVPTSADRKPTAALTTQDLSLDIRAYARALVVGPVGWF